MHGYEAIDRAYKKGEISLDQKILYQFYPETIPDKLPVRLRRQVQAPVKCGTPLILDYKNNRQYLSQNTIARVEQWLASSRLQAQHSYISPMGYFEIYYDVSGEDAVPAQDIEGESGIPDYVEWVAAAADSSWRYEINTLGYPVPITDNTNPYPVFIRKAAVGGDEVYGYTQVGSGIAMSAETSIVIHNNFIGFPPNGDPEGDQRGAIKVTMAHELKHAINYVINGWSGESARWGEMDATLMEEIIYDNVNDYYNYLNSTDSIFLNPQESFYPGSYYDVSWALYFEETYGPEFWVNVWKRIKANPSVHFTEAISRELGGPSFFRQAYITSHLWHFASGPEYSAAGYGFGESASYPAPSVRDSSNFFSTDFSIPRIVAHHPEQANFSARYYRILPPGDAAGEVILEIGSQISGVGAGAIAYFKNGTVDTRVYPSASLEFSLKRPGWNWNELEYIGLVLTNSSETDTLQSASVKISDNTFNNLSLSQNYPNPFSLHTTIRFAVAKRTHVQIRIYDVIGRLVKILDNEIVTPGIYEQLFNSGDLASGIYIYQLVTDSEVLTKKMTLIR